MQRSCAELKDCSIWLRNRKVLLWLRETDFAGVCPSVESIDASARGAPPSAEVPPAASGATPPLGAPAAVSVDEAVPVLGVAVDRMLLVAASASSRVGALAGASELPSIIGAPAAADCELPKTAMN
jgi:hypothetical protein